MNISHVSLPSACVLVGVCLPGVLVATLCERSQLQQKVGFMRFKDCRPDKLFKSLLTLASKLSKFLSQLTPNDYCTRR